VVVISATSDRRSQTTEKKKEKNKRGNPEKAATSARIKMRDEARKTASTLKKPPRSGRETQGLSEAYQDGAGSRNPRKQRNAQGLRKRGGAATSRNELFAAARIKRGEQALGKRRNRRCEEERWILQRTKNINTPWITRYSHLEKINKLSSSRGNSIQAHE